MPCHNCFKRQKLSPVEQRIAYRVSRGLPWDDLVPELENEPLEVIESESIEPEELGETLQFTVPDEPQADD